MVSERPFEVDGLTPAELVYPGSPEEVAEIVSRCASNKQAVIPRGGGTMMGLGNIPRAADTMLCSTQLDRVLDYVPADLVVTVQAGVRLAVLQRLLAGNGQFLALDPPLPEEATIGGIIAANSSGPLRLRYGACRDLLIGIRVVNADGRITKAGGKVVKNVTGYDMCKLYTGSLGTLGIIVEASLKLTPLPQAEITVVAWFPNVPSAYRAARAIYRTGLPLRACELLSPGAASAMELGGGYALTMWLGGGEAALARQQREVLDLCSAAERRETFQEDLHRRLWRSIEDFHACQHETVISVSVTPSRVDQLLASLDPSALFVSHVLTGVTRVFDTPPEGLRPIGEALGGYVVVEACPLEVKRRLDVWGPVGTDFRLMERIKHEFDPDGILNPGRYVGRL